MNQHDNDTKIMKLRIEIKRLEELNKMLQTNMYYYEYRQRDESIKLLQASDKIRKLEAIISKFNMDKLEQQKEPVTE